MTYYYSNHEDGYCEYDTLDEAIAAAEGSRWESSEKACVFNSDDEAVWEDGSLITDAEFRDLMEDLEDSNE